MLLYADKKKKILNKKLVRSLMLHHICRGGQYRVPKYRCTFLVPVPRTF